MSGTPPTERTALWAFMPQQRRGPCHVWIPVMAQMANWSMQR